MAFVIAQILGFIVIIICSIIPQFKRTELTSHTNKTEKVMLQ